MSHSPEEVHPHGSRLHQRRDVHDGDPEFRITSSNAEAKAITGLSREQALAHECYEAMRSELSGRRGFGDMIGASRAMQEIFRLISDVAPTDHRC